MASSKGRLSEAALEKEQARDSHKPEDGGQAGEAIMEYTKEELKEFDRLTRMGSSLDQMDRIKSRLSVRQFIAKHGRAKCDAMFAELRRRDEGVRMRKP